MPSVPQTPKTRSVEQVAGEMEKAIEAIVSGDEVVVKGHDGKRYRVVRYTPPKNSWASRCR
ncbi:MAG: hypothetical protein ACFB20_06335 [Opitutales bacterium]